MSEGRSKIRAVDADLILCSTWGVLGQQCEGVELHVLLRITSREPWDGARPAEHVDNASRAYSYKAATQVVVVTVHARYRAARYQAFYVRIRYVV